MNQHLLTPEETAERLAVSRKSIMNWLRSGQLPGVKIGKLWRIKESELEQFIEARASNRAYKFREYSVEEINEFISSDQISEETARKFEDWLR